jgi:ABC-type nitrate/sulfonate/bicarbonate transport system substrate-binding protein
MRFPLQGSRLGPWLLLAIALSAQSCSALRSSPPQEPIHLRVIMAPYMSNAPLYIAQQEGYFAAEGLDVEFVDLEDTESMVALIQGDLDVMTDLVGAGLLNAISMDTPIRIVADKGYMDPTGCTVNAIMARSALLESGALESREGLRGRIISFEPETLDGYVLETALAPFGLNADDVQAVDVPRPAEIDGFASESLDLTSTSEPWVTRIAQAGYGGIWRSLQEVLPDMQYAVFVYGPTLLQENPEAGRRFMTAYLRAVRQYNEGKTERNMELLGEFTGQDEAFLQEACWPAFRSDGSINTQSILDFQAWAFEKELVDGLLTTEQFWDPSFVNYASGMID